MTTLISQLSGYGFIALTAVLGVIFVVHGYAKVKNPSMMAGFWWGSKTLAFLHGASEMAAGLAVALNVGQSYGAALLAIVTVGAIYEKLFKWKTAFWSHTSEGWEFDLLILASALLILFG